MTIAQIKLLPSYKALTRIGFTDQNIVEFYSLPNGQRTAFLNSFKEAKQTAVITPRVVPTVAIATPTNLGTQKCTSVSVAQVRRMALEHMDKDFIIGGRTFNMSKMNWTFEFSNHKRSFGQCFRKRRRNMLGDIELFNKTLKLSQWLVVNSDKDYDAWVNTMLHEIAHAIDVETRGTSSHDYRWRNIALTIGCDGERCSNADVDATNAKYTLTCDSCGNETAGHKKRSRKTACVPCCNKHNGGRFSHDYVLEVTQNY